MSNDNGIDCPISGCEAKADPELVIEFTICKTCHYAIARGAVLSLAPIFIPAHEMKIEKEQPYCEAQVGGMECGSHVDKWGHQCKTHDPKGAARRKARNIEENKQYPCTFPETNHEALMDNLHAVVKQRDEARTEVERLRKMVVEYVKYGYISEMILYALELEGVHRD